MIHSVVFCPWSWKKQTSRWTYRCSGFTERCWCCSRLTARKKSTIWSSTWSCRALALLFSSMGWGWIFWSGLRNRTCLFRKSGSAGQRRHCSFFSLAAGEWWTYLALLSTWRELPWWIYAVFLRRERKGLRCRPFTDSSRGKKEMEELVQAWLASSYSFWLFSCYKILFLLRTLLTDRAQSMRWLGLAWKPTSVHLYYQSNL